MLYGLNKKIFKKTSKNIWNCTIPLHIFVKNYKIMKQFISLAAALFYLFMAFALPAMIFIYTDPSALNLFAACFFFTVCLIGFVSYLKLSNQ